MLTLSHCIQMLAYSIHEKSDVASWLGSDVAILLVVLRSIIDILILRHFCTIFIDPDRLSTDQRGFGQ